MRATLNKDIKTGNFDVTDDYSTVGPSSVFHIKNEIPEWVEPTCYVLNPGTCTGDQWAQVLNGTVLIKDFIVVEYDVEKKVTAGLDFEEELVEAGLNGFQKVLKQTGL